jgi:hypothetical protein
VNSGVRHMVQRKRRVAIKADAAVLLERLMARYSDTFSDRELREIGEMRMRLQPPVGVKAPIILTGYTK